MAVIVVDNHADRLSQLEESLRSIFEAEEILALTNQFEAIRYSFCNSVSFAFLDASLLPIHILNFAQLLHGRNKNTRIYLMVDKDDFIPDTDKFGVTACLTRPVSIETLRKTIKTNKAQERGSNPNA